MSVVTLLSIFGRLRYLVVNSDSPSEVASKNMDSRAAIYILWWHFRYIRSEIVYDDDKWKGCIQLNFFC